MIEPRSIKIISSNARRVVNHKSKIAISVIWVFSLLAMAFIFFDNKDFIKQPSLQDTTTHSLIKQPPVAANTSNENDSKSESFVLVQYNKKLILTKYSAIAEAVATDSVKQNTPPLINENKPVIIKRPKNNQQKENEEFFIKTVPQ
jgi:hypothetical protein